MDAPHQQSASPPPVLPYASPAPSAPVLTPEHLAQLVAARRLGTGLRRAVTIGKVDGWTTGIFGAITLLGSIGSLPGTLLGAGMVVLAVLQIRAADRLKQLDEAAPIALARNQIILGILLFAYGGISLVLSMRNPLSLASSAGAMAPELSQMIAGYEDLLRRLIITVYATVMAVAVLGPGLTAIYYYAQRKRILAYRSSTPQWILALQHAGVVI